MPSWMQDLLERFARERCSAILRTTHTEAVGPAMAAAIAGGFRIVEFTMNTPGALEQIHSLAGRPDLLLGAGTVLSVADAAAAKEAGAHFLVSPVADPAVIEFSLRNELLCIPGAFTPAEMLGAHRAGAPVVKLFPAPPGGPAYVTACLGPLPFLRIFPTAGVTEQNAAEFLQAGAFGVGFVGCLFVDADLAAGRFEAIEARARRMLTAVAGA